MPPRAEFLRAAITGSAASLFGRYQTVRLSDTGRALDADFSGANVLLRTSNQLFAALGLIELDGVAARIVIAPPDINPEHLPAIVERAGIETVVSNDPALAIKGVYFARLHLPRPSQDRRPLARDSALEGEVAVASLAMRRPEGVSCVRSCGPLRARSPPKR